jgi:hypothetical protein
MASAKSAAIAPAGAVPAAGNSVVVDVDGKPKNSQFRGNLFQEEVVLTEKQKLRNEILENKARAKDKMKYMTAHDMFALFDEDDSGRISFEEFRKLLPYIDVNISDAKAFRYFRLCDTDGSGEIDVEEFMVAIFLCDPVSAPSHIILYVSTLFLMFNRRMETP